MCLHMLFSSECRLFSVRFKNCFKCLHKIVGFIVQKAFNMNTKIVFNWPDEEKKSVVATAETIAMHQ